MAQGARLLRLRKRIVWLTVVAIHLWAAHANADELVHFASAAAKPTPFQERNAQQNGQVLKALPGTTLNGYLTRPPGEGPFPAIVVLHGCGGLSPNVRKTWSERLSSRGYVVLVVDSFSTRGIKDTCGRLLADRVYDAYGALEFISKYSFVDPQRVALMGFSAGGIATLEAVQLGGAEQLMERKFKAAVAYYPNCSATNGDMAVPTLILIGELDDWTPAKNCQVMMAQRSGQGSAVQLDVFKGARHGFDSPGLKTGIEVHGHRMEYNAAAADQSISDVRVFLQHVFREP
ncbi:dienelactone hydrolase family protein [Mesorhizobium sp. AR10]|uniref:dienelactone hydrolase family protein n=1 Tax=Mesorhizobium sp. AR10 TaxID=2865839 RepID=UPI0021610967|nr:dienelactone hydrolase family protein [Mesorhizobium sp. AR10]UVK40837.1 dienelactone hydrolase family protein [Mesorhizobium sp. AR10]